MRISLLTILALISVTQSEKVEVNIFYDASNGKSRHFFTRPLLNLIKAPGFESSVNQSMFPQVNNKIDVKCFNPNGSCVLNEQHACAQKNIGFPLNIRFVACTEYQIDQDFGDTIDMITEKCTNFLEIDENLIKQCIVDGSGRDSLEENKNFLANFLEIKTDPAFLVNSQVFLQDEVDAATTDFIKFVCMSKERFKQTELCTNYFDKTVLYDPQDEFSGIFTKELEKEIKAEQLEIITKIEPKKQAEPLKTIVEPSQLEIIQESNGNLQKNENLQEKKIETKKNEKIEGKTKGAVPKTIAELPKPEFLQESTEILKEDTEILLEGTELLQEIKEFSKEKKIDTKKNINKGKNVQVDVKIEPIVKVVPQKTIEKPQIPENVKLGTESSKKNISKSPKEKISVEKKIKVIEEKNQTQEAKVEPITKVDPPKTIEKHQKPEKTEIDVEISQKSDNKLSKQEIPTKNESTQTENLIKEKTIQNKNEAEKEQNPSKKDKIHRNVSDMLPKESADNISKHEKAKKTFDGLKLMAKDFDKMLETVNQNMMEQVEGFKANIGQLNELREFKTKLDTSMAQLLEWHYEEKQAKEILLAKARNQNDNQDQNVISVDRKSSVGSTLHTSSQNYQPENILKKLTKKVDDLDQDVEKEGKKTENILEKLKDVQSQYPVTSNPTEKIKASKIPNKNKLDQKNQQTPENNPKSPQNNQTPDKAQNLIKQKPSKT